jgi:hypothetical protein
MCLINSSPNLSLPDHVLLHHFHLGLSKEAALHIDISSGGSLLHKTISEGKAILEKILENTPYTGIFDEFLEEEEVKPSPTNKRKHTQPNSKFFQILLMIWLPKNLSLREHTTL